MNNIPKNTDQDVNKKVFDANFELIYGKPEVEGEGDE